MSNRIYERFVECPGVIEIRWVSDDPDHHRPSEDMFLCQNNGIPEDYGKKDKKTTEQAHFYCCVCECQSASLKTLRAHCEGTQHKRKAEQFFQQFQHKQRKKNSANDSLSPDNSRYLGSLKALHLSQLRQYTPLVGLQYVEEYRSTESGDPPLYLCTLKGCKENNCEFNGEASEMFDHLKSQSHGWSYFHRVYGNEFHQEDYEFEDVLRRILVEEERYKIKEVKLKTNNKDYNTVRNNARPDSSYVREALELDKEKRTLPKPLPPRKTKPSSTISVTSPKEISSSPTREPPLKRQRSSSPISVPRIESTVAANAAPTEYDPVKKFNHDVANWVMKCLNIYYQYPHNRHSCIRKIPGPVEYTTLAKGYSKHFRQSEKESYIQVNRTLDGLEMNLDMADRIKLNIDMEFETKPLFPLD